MAQGLVRLALGDVDLVDGGAHPQGFDHRVAALDDAVGLRVLGGGAGQHSPAHHQLPQRLADVGVVGKIFGNDVIGTL